MKVKEIVAAIEQAFPLPFSETCDIYHCGNPEAEVTKIASVFMADAGVVREAIRQGVDLIITHEPTWHAGLAMPVWMDPSAGEWTGKDPVFLEKKRLLDESGITIWRCHDRMHAHNPDLIYDGWVKEMGWQDYRSADGNPWHYDLPETTLGELADFFKQKLGMESVRLVGNPVQKTKRVSVLVGGGSLGLGDELMPMKDMFEGNIDTIVCGETTEWTSVSYVRDAALLGMNKGMIILGHNRTEEAGMKHFGDWLRPLVGDIPIVFIPSGEPFTCR